MLFKKLAIANSATRVASTGFCVKPSAIDLLVNFVHDDEFVRDSEVDGDCVDQLHVFLRVLCDSM